MELPDVQYGNEQHFVGLGYNQENIKWLWMRAAAISSDIFDSAVKQSERLDTMADRKRKRRSLAAVV